MYRGSEFPRLVGRYIYTDYCPTPYFSLHPDGSGGWIREQVRANNGGTGTSAIGENHAGELFVTNVNNGTIRRIVDQCPMLAPVVTANGASLTSTDANSYSWYVNGEVIPGANTQTIVPAMAGLYHVVGGFDGGCSLASATVQVVATGVKGQDVDRFTAMPVPAHDRITLDGIPEATMFVDLVDHAGRLAQRKEWNNGDRGSIAVADIAEGMYVLRLVDVYGRTLQQRSIQVQH